MYLEKMSGSVITINMLKAVGKVEKVTGKLLGNIPKKGDAVEEFLQDVHQMLKIMQQELSRRR
jgi:uncharacterized protein YjbJ (UPF0337 family)